MDAPRPYSLTPRTPNTWVTPWAGQNVSGAQNQECLGAIPSGPTGGLSRKKIGTGTIPLLRLGLPNQHAWFNIRDTSSAPFGGTFP